MQQVNEAESALCDLALVQQARSGSDHALVILFDRYYNHIFYYLLSQTRNREQSLDLAQETFLDVVRSRKAIPEDRSFRAWLFVVARHNMLHDMRKRRVRRALSLEWLRVKGTEMAAPVNEWDSLPILLEDAELQRVLADLTPTLREPLVLIGMGYSIVEIAGMLDISYPAARKRVSRAMQQVRERYHSIDENKDGSE